RETKPKRRETFPVCTSSGTERNFGIWNCIEPKFLSVPLDVHTGNVSRRLGLVSRKQNDWKTVEELDCILRKMDADDPAKYDFALFGIGVTGELEE
ncbi:MAG: DUF2400 family protein, partial [Bergeyella sp.]